MVFAHFMIDNFVWIFVEYVFMTFTNLANFMNPNNILATLDINAWMNDE